MCHFSPVRSEVDILLKKGDVVKIDLGAHIDGFVAVSAFTTVVGATKENPATGRAADAVLAAYNASQIALRLLKPGNAVSSSFDSLLLLLISCILDLMMKSL